jgi:hypothetical protein
MYFGLTLAVDDVDQPNSWMSSLPHRDIFKIKPREPTQDAIFRLLRCLYYSMTVYTGQWIVNEPRTLIEFAFCFLVMVFGLFLLGYVVGEASTLCIYLIQNEVEFQINQMNIMEFLVRKRIADRDMEHRVHSFLSYWWSSHSGVTYHTILEQLPKHIRAQAVLEIARASIASFVMRYMHPLSQDVASMEKLMFALAHRLVFEGYPAGETVIVQGNIGQTMYFVSSGSLISASTALNFVPTRYRFLLCVLMCRMK